MCAVMEESYEDLLRNFNAGSERAFKKLYDSHFGAACSFVAQYVADTFTVEDIVQETFIHIWEKRGTYADFVHFKAYLYKSLRNNTLLFLRDSCPSEEPDASVPDDTDNALQAIITEEVHREIIAAIKKLPQERQKIIELTMLGDSQEEVARKLGISVNTVKTQKRMAYAFLREELKNLFVWFMVLLYL